MSSVYDSGSVGTTGREPFEDSYGINSSDQGAIAAGTGAPSGLQSNDTRQTTSHVDRVGNLGQGSAFLDRTTHEGPQTTGAAGTDRFDSDRVHPGQSGNTYGNRYADDAGLTGEPGAPESYQTKSQAAVASAVHTSDREFTNRTNDSILDAYHDTHGIYKGNTSGPNGYSALTGREGTLENNPVYQAKSREAEPGVDNGGDTTGENKKTGFVQKLKEIL